MKKINILGVLLITVFILLTCACGTSKKTTTPTSAKSEYPCDSIKVLTTGLIDSNKLSDEVLETADLYLSQPIQISRVTRSLSSRTENGVIIVTDSIEDVLRDFDYKTSVGKIDGVPQRDPDKDGVKQRVKSYSVFFTNSKNGASYEFKFNLSGIYYVLDRVAKATYQGKTFDIITYDPASLQTGTCKLKVCLKRETIRIVDHK